MLLISKPDPKHLFFETNEMMDCCLDSLREAAPLSPNEFAAAISLFTSVLDYCESAGIISEYDAEALTDSLRKNHDLYLAADASKNTMGSNKERPSLQHRP